MTKNNLKFLLANIIVVLVGVGVAFAGSQGGVKIGDIPLFAFCVALAFLIQLLAFIPAYLKKTEKFYDLTGSITYISITLIAVILSPEADFRTYLLMGLILIWAGRLGTFLFRRVLKSGKDKRFDEIKKSALRFLLTWMLQGLWVSFTIAAALAAITVEEKVSFGFFGILGLLIWILGFSFEAIADHQKNQFRKNPENQGKFINSGLWSISRHPNYFGEITIWLGIAIIALPTLEGLRFVTLISPLFVAFLLIKISGIPKLEEYADKKWGGQEDYEEYKENTPILIPKLKFPK